MVDRTVSKPGTVFTASSMGRVTVAIISSAGISPLSIMMATRGKLVWGKTLEGMEVADHLYSAYGDGPPRGSGPDQELIERQGNAYLDAQFPNLDVIRRARIVTAGR